MPVTARRGLVTMLGALVLSVASIAPASAATSGVVYVHAEAGSTIEITIPDHMADFGSELTADGSPPVGGESSLAGTDMSGACYSWPGSVTVRSNRTYDVSVVGNTYNNYLDVLMYQPWSYWACVMGWQVNPSMPTTIVYGAGATAGSQHDYWLGLEVPWTLGSSTTFADATLTFTVSAQP